MRKFTTSLIPSFAALALVATAGCKDPTACSNTSDCFEGEVCISGNCGPEMTAMSNGTTGGMTITSDMGAADSGTDTGSPDEDMGEVTPDMSSEDTGAVDDMTVARDADGTCIADPFDSCPGDDDDRFAEQITNVGFGRGCVRVDDNFEGGTVEVNDRTLCPREMADKYSIGVNPCETSSFFVDVKVTPAAQCLLDDWALDARLGQLGCGDANVQCTDNGVARTVTFIVEPDNTVLGLNVNITPVTQDVRFDYDLEITYRN